MIRADADIGLETIAYERQLIAFARQTARQIVHRRGHGLAEDLRTHARGRIYHFDHRARVRNESARHGTVDVGMRRKKRLTRADQIARRTDARIRQIRVKPEHHDLSVRLPCRDRNAHTAKQRVQIGVPEQINRFARILAQQEPSCHERRQKNFIRRHGESDLFQSAAARFHAVRRIIAEEVVVSAALLNGVQRGVRSGNDVVSEIKRAVHIYDKILGFFKQSLSPLKYYYTSYSAICKQFRQFFRHSQCRL